MGVGSGGVRRAAPRVSSKETNILKEALEAMRRVRISTGNCTFTHKDANGSVLRRAQELLGQVTERLVLVLCICIYSITSLSVSLSFVSLFSLFSLTLSMVGTRRGEARNRLLPYVWCEPKL